jgi:hypothetical protein
MSVHANELWNDYVWAYEHMCLAPIRHLSYASIRCISYTSVAPLGYTEVLFQLCCLDKCKCTDK